MEPSDSDPSLTPDLWLAFYHVLHCAATDKPCAALLGELHRLYTAAGEPVPDMLRPGRPAAAPQPALWNDRGNHE